MASGPAGKGGRLAGAGQEGLDADGELGVALGQERA
jgi:hypothetical protein